MEVGASYVTADGTTSLNSAAVGPTVSLLNLNGAGAIGILCNAGPTCSVTGSLTSSYNSWQLNGKAMYDWNLGVIKLTPSAALFGGASHANQTLAQAFFFSL